MTTAVDAHAHLLVDDIHHLLIQGETARAGGATTAPPPYGHRHRGSEMAHVYVKSDRNAFPDKASMLDTLIRQTNQKRTNILFIGDK